MRTFSFLLAAGLFMAGSSAVKLTCAEPAPPGLSTCISFAPDSTNTDAYSCCAEIIDLADGRCLGRPTILAAKGEAFKVRIGDEKSNLMLDVMVNKAGTTGTFTVTYSKSGKVVNIQKGSISIRP